MAKGRKSADTSSPPYRELVSKYSARFKAGTEDDQTKVTEDERHRRRDDSASLAEDYYEFASDAYERGWSTHFHYTPYAPNESIQQAQAFYEHRLALLTGLKPGMKVLDVGCGIGAPAREIAKFIGCEIVGVSINQSHIDRAVELTAQEGLSHLCTFVRANFLNLPFSSHSFDAAYAIESTVHAPTYAQAYTEISRVLKPDAPFGLSEWVLTPSFDPNNPHHIGIRNRIERGNGIANIDTSTAARHALTASGFQIAHEEDYAQHWTETLHFSPVPTSSTTNNKAPDSKKTPSVRPWYFPLQGHTHLTTSRDDWWTAACMRPTVRRLVFAAVWTLEKVLCVYPRGACEAMDTIGLCVDSVVEGGIEGVFSPCWWFVCRKRTEVEVDYDQGGGRRSQASE